MATRKWPKSIFSFFLNFSGSSGRNCQVGIEGHHRFFSNLHYKFFDLKQKFETNFIMSKALFEWHNPKKTTKKVLLKGVLGHVNHFFNKKSSLYWKFLLSQWFSKGMMMRRYSSSPNFQIDNIIKNKKNHRKSENNE